MYKTMYLSNYVRQQVVYHLFKIKGTLKTKNVKLIKNLFMGYISR